MLSSGVEWTVEMGWRGWLGGSLLTWFVVDAGPGRIGKMFMIFWSSQ